METMYVLFEIAFTFGLYFLGTAMGVYFVCKMVSFVMSYLQNVEVEDVNAPQPRRRAIIKPISSHSVARVRFMAS